MVAFEIYLNEQLLCTAGIGEDGVLTSILTWVKRNNGDEQCELEISGLVSVIQEHVKWIARLVAIGDHIEIKIVETGKVDSPAVRQCRDPEANIGRQK
jgi:hypothetical protein